MSAAERHCPEETSTRSDEHAKLLEEALRQPGVKELMEVYESCRGIESTTRAHRQAMRPQRVVWTSINSRPIDQSSA